MSKAPYVIACEQTLWSGKERIETKGENEQRDMEGVGKRHGGGGEETWRGWGRKVGKRHGGGGEETWRG